MRRTGYLKKIPVRLLLSGLLLGSLLQSGPTWARPAVVSAPSQLQLAQKELREWRFFEAAQLAHRLPGFSARALEIQALAESDQVGEAWQILRSLPPESRQQAMFYVLRGELSGHQGSKDATIKDFQEALRLAVSGPKEGGLSPVVVLSRFSVALGHCKDVELSRQNWLEALKLSQGRRLTAEEFLAIHWAQVLLAFNSSEPWQGFAPLSALEEFYGHASPANTGGLARVALWRCVICSRSGELSRARAELEKAFSLYLSQPNRSGMSDCLRLAGGLVSIRDNNRAGRDWAQGFCLKGSKMRAYPELQVLSYVGLAQLASYGEGNFSAALAWLDKALQSAPGDRWRIRVYSEHLKCLRGGGADLSPWLTRRWALMQKLAPWAPEDPLYPYSQKDQYLAQLAEYRLHEEPGKALELYQEALTSATDLRARLQILQSQLVRGAEASSIRVMHDALGKILGLLESPITGEQRLEIMEDLVSTAASRTRLREMWDDRLLPRAESSLGVLLRTVLARKAELAQLEQLQQKQLEQSLELSQMTVAVTRARKLASLLLIQERFQEAIWTLDRGIQFAAKLHWSEREASSRELRARLCHSLGREQEALDELERARALYLQVANGDALGDAAYVQALRSLYLRKAGRVEEALQCVDGALRESRLLPNDRLFLHLQRALALEGLGRNREALGAATSALALNEHGLVRITLLLLVARLQVKEHAEKEALENLERAFKLAHRLHSLSIREIGLEMGHLLEVVGRGAEALEVFHRTSARIDQLSSEYPSETRIAVERNASTIAIRSKVGRTNPVAESRPGVDSGDAGTRVAFLQQCNLARSQYAAWDAQLPVGANDFANLQANLAPRQVLAQFVLTPHEIHLLVLSHHRIRFLRVRVELEQVRRWLDQVWSSESGAEARLNLFRVFVEPWEREFDGGSLGILPTSELWYLPWSALPDEQGRLLCEKMQCDIRAPQDVRAPLPPWRLEPEKWVVVGGAEVDLPETRKEVDYIHALFPQSRLLVGPQASRGGFIEACQGASLVHVASHSSVHPTDVNLSSLELADGALTLNQLYQVRLSPGALVVMSSCRSAVGEGRPGKEVGSLASAWAAAGAGQVVATLRQVEDDASRRFFEIYYEKLRRGESPSEALRTTQVDLARKGESVADWAPFVLMGRP